MSRVARALIVGCGYVGDALAELLLAGGVETWTLRRSARPDPRAIATDVADANALAQALAPLRNGAALTVFYLVGAGSYADDAYRRAYVDGVANLLAPSLPIARLLFASSTAVYGQSDGSVVDEASITIPQSFSGQRLLEGEALVGTAPPEATAVRFGGIYGPGRTRLIDRIADGVAIASTEQRRYTNRIHRDDCAAVLLHLANLERVQDRYVAVDDEPSDQRAVQRWLCTQLGRDPASLRASATGQRRGGDKRCSNALLKASGYRFRYPSYRDGYGMLLRDRG